MTKTILWIVLPYLFISSLWITLSDGALGALPLAPHSRTLLSVYKGWGFVLVTSVLLVALLHSKLRALAAVQDELMENETRLRLLGDNLPDSYVYQYIHESDGTPRFVYLSAGVERLHGLKVDSVLQDAHLLHRQITPEQWPALVAAEEDSLQDLTDFAMELRMRRADGQWRWLQVRSRPRRRADGQFVWDGVATDITDRKQMEGTLRQERDFSDTVLDSLPGVFYCYAENLEFRRWNKNFARITGYRDEEIARMSPLDFFAGADKDLVATRIREVFDQGESSAEADFVAKDGTHTPYYFTGLTTEIEGQRHLVGVGIDISRRRRAEAALAESEARWRTIAAHTPDHVVMQDRELRYQSVINPQLGLTESQMLGKTDADLLSAEDAERLTAIKRKVLSSGQPVRLVLPVRNLKGETEYFEGDYVPSLDAAGRANGVIGYFRNITDRKRVEAERDAHAQRNENLVRALGQIVYEHDVPADDITWTGETEKMLGYTPAEMGHTEADWLRLVHPDDVGKVKAQFAADPRNDMFEVECRYRHKRGHYAWTFDRGVIRRDAEGRIVRVSGILRDISERKQAEAALRESHERLKKVLEIETVGVMFWDLTTGRMTDANDAFLRIMGYSRQEVEAGELTWQKLTPPEYTEASLAEIRKFQATGRVGPYEKEYLHKDGTRQWFVFAGSSLGGNTCVEFCVDISDRKRAEAALRESEERLRLATDAARLGTFDWDLQLNRIVWSHWHEELWGFQSGEFGGTYESFASRVLPEDMPGINAEIQRCIAKQRHFSLEFRVAWPDGSIHWILGQGQFTFAADGQPLRMRGVVKEVTERKLAEEEVRRSREQLRALTARLETLQEEERTRISREIHDELGQMLTGIKMDLRWIEHRLDDFGDDRRVNPILDKLVTAAELADATVKTVQRIAAELRPGILDKLGLGMALQYEAAQFEARTGIACRVFVPDTEPALAPHTATAFFRIFQEALTNVARHARATTVEVDLRPEADACHLEVRDDGRGITGRDVANPGSLGLLGMQERARLLGGEVAFTSRPGGGTVVAVRIPNPATGQTGQ